MANTIAPKPDPSTPTDIALPKPATPKADAAPVNAPNPRVLSWQGPIRGVVETSATGFVTATNHSYQDAMALMKSRQLPNNAINAALITQAMDTRPLNPEQRLELIRTISADDRSGPLDDLRRQRALASLLDVGAGSRPQLARALTQGAPGERLVDRIGKVVTDDALDVKISQSLGKELRRAREEWTRTFEPTDQLLRSELGTVAASRTLMHAAFPFNDAPFSGISSTVDKKTGQMTVVLNGDPSVKLGEPFAVPSSNKEVQAEIKKRFNQHYYGVDVAPPAYLNALISDFKVPKPGAPIANAFSKVNGDNVVKVAASNWNEFMGGRAGTPPEAVRAQLLEKTKHLYSSNQAALLARDIKVEGGSLVMPSMAAKRIIEAQQLNDKGREFFAADRECPTEFVRQIGSSLKFVLPPSLATAFQPLTETKIISPQHALEVLTERMGELGLGTPSLSADGQLVVDPDDAKRLLAAAMFSYAGAAKNDIRNVFGGAQLSGIAYLPMDGVARGEGGVTAENTQRELEKRAEGQVPEGAQARKLKRLGFEIEKEVATPLGQALVIRNDKLGLVRVVFRGSDRLKDFVTDARAAQLPFDVDGQKFLAPAGFLRSVQSMYPEIVKAVQSAAAKISERGLTPKLGVEGHSKGGAEAALFSLYAQADRRQNGLPEAQQINLIEPARSISRWDAYDPAASWSPGLLKDMTNAGANWIAGLWGDLTTTPTSANTAADFYQKNLSDKTSAWAMSRDAVPHAGLYRSITGVAAFAAGRVKPGNVMHFDQATGTIRGGVEKKPTEWYAEDRFVLKQEKNLLGQGISFSSHMMGNVEPTIFDQIGSGVMSY